MGYYGPRMSMHAPWARKAEAAGKKVATSAKEEKVREGRI